MSPFERKDIPLKLDIAVRYAPGINFIIRHDLIKAFDAENPKRELRLLIWDAPEASIPPEVRAMLKECWTEAYEPKPVTPQTARKPLDEDAFFKTMRALNPSERLLEDIATVERQTRERSGQADSSK